MARNRAQYQPTMFEKALWGYFKQMFPMYYNRFRIVTMKRSLNPDIKFVWAMENGKIPEIVDVYFLNDYMCEVNESMLPQQVEALLIHCLKQYETGMKAKAGFKI